MVGTLIDIGLGRRPPGSIAQALSSQSRDTAGRTAPAHGLYLVSVRYPEALLTPGVDLPDDGEPPPRAEEAEEE